MPEITRDSDNRASGFIYYMHDESEAFRFELAGALTQDDTADLDQARQTASSVFGGRSLVVDLTCIEGIDTAGRELLERWHGLGALLVVTTPETKVRIHAMIGVPIRFVEKHSEGFEWLRGRAAVWLLAAAFVLSSVAAVFSFR